MNKQKSKQQFSAQSQRASTALLDHSLTEELQQWQRTWMLESKYDTFFVQSDSGIIVRPDQTIEIGSGTVFFTQSTQQSTLAEEAKASKQEHTNQLEVHSDESESTEEKAFLKEKDKYSFNFLEWLVFAVLVVWVVWRG